VALMKKTEEYHCKEIGVSIDMSAVLVKQDKSLQVEDANHVAVTSSL